VTAVASRAPSALVASARTKSLVGVQIQAARPANRRVTAGQSRQRLDREPSQVYLRTVGLVDPQIVLLVAL
jgi:hypothetical protein